jgi:rod shape-determining protein MreC
MLMLLYLAKNPCQELKKCDKINSMKLPPRFKIGLIAVLLIAFFVILNLTGFSKEVKNFFYLISSPIQKTLWQAGNNISDFFEAISGTEKLKKENEELLLKNQELLVENAGLRELEKENEVLRKALEIGLEKEFKLLLAEVRGKDVSQDTLLINKGSKDGILKGLPVITQQKALIGKCGEVYENFSKVNLISHKESSFDAKISDSDIQGVVKGEGNLKLFLDLIPKEKEIEEGAPVFTTVLGGIFPEGLLVGEIKEVLKSDIQPWQEAEIEPAFDIKGLETLFVITNF